MLLLSIVHLCLCFMFSVLHLSFFSYSLDAKDLRFKLLVFALRNGNSLYASDVCFKLLELAVRNVDSLYAIIFRFNNVAKHGKMRQTIHEGNHVHDIYCRTLSSQHGKQNPTNARIVMIKITHRSRKLCA